MNDFFHLNNPLLKLVIMNLSMKNKITQQKYVRGCFLIKQRGSYSLIGETEN